MRSCPPRLYGCLICFCFLLSCATAFAAETIQQPLETTTAFSLLRKPQFSLYSESYVRSSQFVNETQFKYFLLNWKSLRPYVGAWWQTDPARVQTPHRWLVGGGLRWSPLPNWGYVFFESRTNAENHKTDWRGGLIASSLWVGSKTWAPFAEYYFEFLQTTEVPGSWLGTLFVRGGPRYKASKNFLTDLYIEGKTQHDTRSLQASKDEMRAGVRLQALIPTWGASVSIFGYETMVWQKSKNELARPAPEFLLVLAGDI